MNFLVELGKSFQPSHDAFIFMWILAVLGVIAVLTALERWLSLKQRTDYDALGLFEKVKNLIDTKKLDEALSICLSGGRRALPRILASGIKKAMEEPHLIAGAMAEESTHMASVLEKRMNILVMFGNVFTLFGLLGTVYGLIMSFDAVSRPEVAAIEKSALLASGISTAMNSTLVGLTLSVITVMLYAFIRARVDASLSEIDRYSMATLNILMPPDITQKKLTALNRGGQEEEAADADVTPMLNLMVILIPVLLTSSEFVKVGAIELKLPESAQSGGVGGSSVAPDAKLDVGVVITAKGFNVFNYFKAEDKAGPQAVGEKLPDIPLEKGAYNFIALGNRFAEIKKKALLEILKSSGSAPSDATLYQLYKAYVAKDFSAVKVFADHENVKIVAEDKIKYETVVSVMDAARGIRTTEGSVTLFPNVSIAGGIIQ
ncbi:MAG TPA: MotA/TolQ/ExbB proton channel family protein [Chitinivibrionales bacterium]